jgi:cytochrome c553
MSITRTPRSSRHGWLVFLACATSTAAAAGASAVGCDDQRPTLAPTSGAGGETGAGGSTSTETTATEDKAHQLFDALAPDLMKACGGCHDANGSSYMPFLRQPTYQSITTWPGIVTKDPTQSKLEVHPVQGGKHSGTNLDSDALKDTLFPKVK